MKNSNKSIVVGSGKSCPKCKELMERRKHPNNWSSMKNHYFTQWDYCRSCRHVQHYDEFMNTTWKEKENQDSFFKESRN